MWLLKANIMKLMKKNRASSLCVLIAIAIGSLIPFPGCDDDFIIVIKKEIKPPTVPGNNVQLLPGGGGSLVVSNITASSLSLRWEAATSGDEPVTGVTYTVYLSNDYMTTRDMMRAYGTHVETGIDFYFVVVDQLLAGTTYHLNVLAEIPGYECAYTMVSITTLSTGSIYMFSTEITKGNLVGGRIGADRLCTFTKESVYNDLPCSHTNAFLSVSEEDSIAAMPLNYFIPGEWPIVGPSGMLIDRNFSDLLDSSIINSLEDAGIAIPEWWSGSFPDGTYNSSEDNCDGWTGGQKAITGSGILRDGGWLNESITNCSNKRPVVCMCW